MKASFSSHISEDLLEKYALRKLTEQELATVEEHLLVCHKCQDRLDEVDEYIQVMKLAVSQHPTLRPRLPSSRVWPFPARFWVATVLLIALVLAIPWQSRNVPVHEVTLAASRGANPIPTAEAAAGAALLLRMDVSEIVKFGGYQVSLVDSEGRELWRKRANANQNQLTVQSPGRLSAGKYWVRLSDTSEPAVFLREYGLELK